MRRDRRSIGLLICMFISLACVMELDAGDKVEQQVARWRDRTAGVIDRHGQLRTLAIQMEAHGQVFWLTKSSEVESDTVTLQTKRSRANVKVLARDLSTDLAVLADAGLSTIGQIKGLSDIGELLTDRKLLPGQMAITTLVKQSKKDYLSGVISASDVTVLPKTPVLGVGLRHSASGPVITEVVDKGPASLAGLKQGDVIRKMNETRMRRTFDVTDFIAESHAGEKIRVSLIRRGRQMSLILRPWPEAEILSTRPVRSSENKETIAVASSNVQVVVTPESLLSQRRHGFVRVIQHDTPLKPNQCGGPLLDLSGNLVGINIARGGRTKSFALPLEEVGQALKRMRGGEQFPSHRFGPVPTGQRAVFRE